MPAPDPQQKDGRGTTQAAGQDHKAKNPWDRNPASPGRKNPWDAPLDRGNGDRGSDGRDIEDFFRRTQDNLFPRAPLGHDKANPGKTLLIIAAALALIWILSGIYTLQPGETAIISHLGQITEMRARPGAGYAEPWPLDNVSIMNTETSHLTQIGAAELPPRHGSVRRSHNVPSPITADGSPVTIDAGIVWKIGDVKSYLTSLQDPEAALRILAGTALDRVVNGEALEDLQADDRAALSERLRSDIQKSLDQLHAGILITSIAIRSVTVPGKLRDADEETVAAQQDADHDRDNANAYRRDLIDKTRSEIEAQLATARKDRDATLAQAREEAEHFNTLLASYRADKETTRLRLYTETMEDILRKAQVTIVDPSTGITALPALPAIGAEPAGSGSESPPPAAVKSPEPSALEASGDSK